MHAMYQTQTEKLSGTLTPGDLCLVINRSAADKDKHFVEVGNVNDPCGDMSDVNVGTLKSNSLVVVVSDRNAVYHGDTFKDDVLVLAPEYGLVWIRELNLTRVEKQCK